MVVEINVSDVDVSPRLKDSEVELVSGDVVAEIDVSTDGVKATDVDDTDTTVDVDNGTTVD